MKKDQYLYQLQKGSETGLRYFMSKYSKPLRFYAFSILRDREVAEEIVSDSFFKLWNGRARIRTEDNIKAFLYLATRNACYNHLSLGSEKWRTQRSVTVDGDEDLFANIQEPGPDLLSTIIYTELVEQVAQLVDRLPARQAQVFRLSFFENRSTEEICEELSTTTGTVYFVRSKAVKTLKKAFAKSGVVFGLLAVVWATLGVLSTIYNWIS